MTDKNIQMTQRNTTNDAWDNLFPKTKASNVAFDDGTTVEAHKADDATDAHNAGNISVTDAEGHFTSDDVEGVLAELFTSGSDGKALLETTIIAKQGTVSKAGTIATFAELDDGILSIPEYAPSAGDVVLTSTTAVKTSTSTAPTLARQAIINKSGSYRISFDMKDSVTSYPVYGQIYVNSVAVGTLQAKQNTSYTTFTEDFSLNEGDTVELYQYSASSSATCYTTNFKSAFKQEFVTITL